MNESQSAMTRTPESHEASEQLQAADILKGQHERMELMLKEAVEIGHKLADERDRLNALNTEMLEALQMLMNAQMVTVDRQRANAKARAAIAKATTQPITKQPRES